MNAIKNKKSQNIAELNQVSSQSTESVYIGHYLSSATALKSHNFPINLSSFTQNTIRSTSQLLEKQERFKGRGGGWEAREQQWGKGIIISSSKNWHERATSSAWLEAKDREATSLSKKCNWVVKWRQETFLGCRFMGRVPTSINLKPNTYFILIHPVAFKLQCTCNWIRNKSQPHPIPWVLSPTSGLLHPCANVFSQPHADSG